MADSDWTPVRNGDIYCSPRCGCKCTYEAYLKAKSDADALCETMGDDWEPAIWENCGWHYRAKNGVATIHPPVGGIPTYSAWIEVGVIGVGENHLQFICSAETPQDALGFAVQEARTAVHRINAALEDLLP